MTVAPAAAVRAGQNVTVSCRSAGFPPPDVILEKASDGSRRRSADGVFRLLNVTAGDSGLYRVNASNRWGHQVRAFRLSVTGAASAAAVDRRLWRRLRKGPFSFPEAGAEAPPAPAAILVPAAVGAAALAAGALLLDYLRRSKKKGSYRLTASSPRHERHPFGAICA